MKIEYNKKWKPVNESDHITDEDFDKRFEIDRQFTFNSLFRKYHIRFVKYPNENLILVSGSYIPNFPKYINSLFDKNIFKNPYRTIWTLLCGVFDDRITESELYSKYKYNYITPKMINRMKVLGELFKNN